MSFYLLRCERDWPEMATTPFWLRSNVVRDVSDTND